jgi:hypothetical protein
MGAGGVDVMLSPKARQLCPLAIECKNTKATPSIAEIKQSQANARMGELPVVAYKPYGKKYDDTLIMCSLEDLLAWLKEDTYICDWE